MYLQTPKPLEDSVMSPVEAGLENQSCLQMENKFRIVLLSDDRGFLLDKLALVPTQEIPQPPPKRPSVHRAYQFDSPRYDQIPCRFQVGT